MVSVLLVEDDPLDQCLTERELRAAIDDLSITSVSDAGQAIEAIADWVSNRDVLPSVVICDLKLPGKSGADLARTLRGCGYLDGVPIIGHSGTQDPREIEHFIESGGTSVVSKEEYGGQALVNNVLAWTSKSFAGRASAI